MSWKYNVCLQCQQQVVWPDGDRGWRTDSGIDLGALRCWAGPETVHVVDLDGQSVSYLRCARCRVPLCQVGFRWVHFIQMTMNCHPPHRQLHKPDLSQRERVEAWLLDA